MTADEESAVRQRAEVEALRWARSYILELEAEVAALKKRVAP